MLTFWMTLLMNKWTNSVMDDWNLDENSLGTWQSLQHCILEIFYKERQIMLGQRLVLVTLYHGLQLVLSETIRIGGTKYHI